MNKKIRKENQQYWADIRQSNNLNPLVECSIISQDQAEIIKRVCQLRHEVHANKTEEWIFNTESANYDSAISSINELQSLIGRTVFTDDEPSDVDLMYGVPHEKYTGELETDDYMSWSLSYIRSRIEELNKLAEEFLKDFDEKFSTRLAPTGAFRRLI
jgi:hypothetical protein